MDGKGRTAAGVEMKGRRAIAAMSKPRAAAKFSICILLTCYPRFFPTEELLTHLANSGLVFRIGMV
jgi:hypothetical protein